MTADMLAKLGKLRILCAHRRGRQGVEQANRVIEAALARVGGRLFGVPTLGQLLKAAGRSYATMSAGTSGGGRLINHSAEADGTFRFAMRRPEAGHPIRIGDKTLPPEIDAALAIWTNTIGII